MQIKENITPIRVKLTEIKPYFRNPRKMNESAINAVAKSIEEYGYNQPIAVDKEMVIVVGHTRYFALKKLGVEEISIVQLDLPEEKAREYRLADNRLNELTEWDFDKLKFEVRELDTGFIKELFLDFDFNTLAKPQKDFEHEGTFGQLPTPMGNDRNSYQKGEITKEKVMCPECGHEFEIS